MTSTAPPAPTTASRRSPAATRRAATAQRGQPEFGQLLPGFQHDLGIDLGRLSFEGKAFFHGHENLANTEQADHGDQEIEALEQFRVAEGHAQLAGDGVHADGGEGEAQHHGRDGLGRRLLAHAHEAGEGEQLHGEEFRRPEFEREPGQQRRREGDQQHGEHGAHEAGEPSSLRLKQEN